MAVVATLLLLISALQIGQYILQRRARWLLSDVQNLQLRQATYEDALSFRRRWGGWTRNTGDCSEIHCQVVVDLNDFLFNHRDILVDRLHLLHSYMLAGGRPARVAASVVVNDGIVWAKGYDVVLGVPAYQSRNGWWPDYILIGDAESRSRSEPVFEPPAEHPNYLVGRPGGCDGPCREIHFNFTPYADPADVRRLMVFDLLCLTRWRHPCREEREIMPAAWAQYELDNTSAIDR